MFSMESKFGRGFIVTLMLIAKHFALPPEQAWYGVGDHMEEFVMPDMFKGTEVEPLVESLRKKVLWHQPGTMDKEDAHEVTLTLNALVVAIDHVLGVKDPRLGEFT